MTDDVVRAVFTALSEHDDFDELVAEAAIKLGLRMYVRFDRDGMLVRATPSALRESCANFTEFGDKDDDWIEDRTPFRQMLDCSPTEELPTVIAAIRAALDEAEAELAR